MKVLLCHSQVTKISPQYLTVWLLTLITYFRPLLCHPLPPPLIPQGDRKEQASLTPQQEQSPQQPEQQQPITRHDALDSSSANNKLNHKHNNDKDKDTTSDKNWEAGRDLLPASVVIVDESCASKSQKQPIEPSIVSRSGATSSSQRRRQLQFQRQKEAKLYDRGDGDRDREREREASTSTSTSTSASTTTTNTVMGGGELVNCIAYDDNTLVIERKPSPSSPSTSRRYLKAETPTRGSRKYNRKSSAKSDLEVVVVKPEHHHQHRSPTITLPVPANPLTTSASAGSSPTGAGLAAGLGTASGTVLQQRYIQLQLENEKKYIFHAMQEFDYMEQSRRSGA